MGGCGIFRLPSHIDARLNDSCAHSGLFRMVASVANIYSNLKRKPYPARPVEVLFFLSSLSLRFSFRVCWGFFFCCFLPLSALPAFPEPAIFNPPNQIDRLNYSMASDLREVETGISALPSAHNCHTRMISSSLAMGARGTDQIPDVALMMT